MLLSPMMKDEVGWNRVIDRAKQRWWAILFSGILSAGAALIILSINWNLGDLAVFLGAYLIFRGWVQMFNAPLGAISNRRWASYWWVVLVLGILEILLGLWLLRRPGLTLAVATTVTGFWALFVGVMQIIVSFELRQLPERLSR